VAGILIEAVDDDPDLLRVTADQLRALGYRVLTAADGAAALEALEQAPEVRLLYTDVVMPPPWDGPALTREALTRRPGLRVLLTSAVRRARALQQLLTAQHPMRRRDEGFEQQELGIGQGHHLTRGVGQHPGGQIQKPACELSAVMPQRRGRPEVQRPGRSPPQHGLDAGHQFAGVERLHDIIVGSQFQTDDPIDIGPHPGQHHDRNR
jgi:CheY-like chemotaxis protein